MQRHPCLAACLVFALSGCVRGAPPTPVSAFAGDPVEAECQAFMAGYARDLIAGDRGAIAGRYDRRGYYRIGNGRKVFEPWQMIEAFYRGPDWQPPTSFQWNDISCEALSRDAVIVAATFDWGEASAPPVRVSYTGLLVRQGGDLRIRLEDESAAPRR